MGHLIPMNLQLNAEVGDRGVVKGDIVPAPERRAAGALGKWPASNMNGLQCPGGAGGGRGPSFGPLSCSAGSSHKGQLDSRLVSFGGLKGGVPRSLAPSQDPKQSVPSGHGGLSRNPPHCD